MNGYGELIIARIHNEEIERAVKHHREIEQAKRERRYSSEKMQRKWQQGVRAFLGREDRPHTNN
jgi:FtsZ-binding cell division protein ZapB